MSTMTDWAGGERCQRHDLAYCADCRDMAGIVRARDGELHYKSDCAVSTFAEITGADYEESFQILSASGYRIGRGTPTEALTGALREAGYNAFRSHLDIDGAIAASATGRAFYVSGRKGRKAHAWSITEGRQNRPYFPPFRYALYEVTA
jgi:hypothetical protein